MLIPEAAPRTSSGPTPAAHAGLKGPHAAPCSHGVPMQQCRHKQDHLNQVNADLVKILLGERAAQPGEQYRLKALKNTIEECIERDVQGGPQGLGQHIAPQAAAMASSASGEQRLHSTVPYHGGALDGGVCSPTTSPEHPDGSLPMYQALSASYIRGAVLAQGAL